MTTHCYGGGVFSSGFGEKETISLKLSDNETYELWDTGFLALDCRNKRFNKTKDGLYKFVSAEGCGSVDAVEGRYLVDTDSFRITVTDKFAGSLSPYNITLHHIACKGNEVTSMASCNESINGTTCNIACEPAQPLPCCLQIKCDFDPIKPCCRCVNGYQKKAIAYGPRPVVHACGPQPTADAHGP